MAISESHVAQLQGRGSPVPDPQSSVGAVYQPRLDVMCDAYDKYNQRLPRAISLLQDLHLSPEFHHFLEVNSQSSFVQHTHIAVELIWWFVKLHHMLAWVPCRVLRAVTSAWSSS